MSIFTASERGGLYARLRERGYITEDATIGGKVIIRTTTPSGRVWTTGKKMVYPMNNHLIHQVADNKQLSYELAHELGMHIPQTTYVDRSTDMTKVWSFLDECSPVIAKPLDGYKSRGVTLDITTQDALRKALEVAYVESPTAIIQEQVMGEEYRFSILEGRVVSVLRRERPQVIGDGISTVRQLVARENEQRRRLHMSDVEYPQWTEETIGDLVENDEVLLAGEVRVLIGTTLVSQGASVYELINETDDSYKEMAVKFAQELGAGFVAIDMFIIDHTQPASRGNYWFNECNTSPSLKMYLAPRNANSSHVIDRVVEITDRYLNITQ